MPADVCCLSLFSSRYLSFLETSKENFNNVPDLELNPIRSKIVRAFFDNRWAFSPEPAQWQAPLSCVTSRGTRFLE